MATVKISEQTDRARRGLPPLQRQKVTYDEKGRLTGDKPVARQNKTEVSHANRRASVTPVARTSHSGRSARASAGIRGFDSESRRDGHRNSRRFNLGGFAFNPRNPSGYQHVLMGEMIVAFGIIGVRAISDYAPSSNKHDPGAEKPVTGSGPVALIAATLAIYFVLSFLATRGGWAARVAAAFGLLMIVALMINSENELTDVANWVENIGSNATNQPSVTSPNTNLPAASDGNPSDPLLVPSSGPGSPSEPLT